METTILQAIDLFLMHRRTQGVSSETLSLYQRTLELWKEWQIAKAKSDRVVDITIEHFRSFFLYLREEHQLHGGNTYGPKQQNIGYAPHSIDSYYRILRTYWHFCDDEEWLTPKQARFFARGRIPRPKIPQRISPSVNDDFIEKLLDGLPDDDSEHTALLRVMILLLYETGMRVSELCSLTDLDINFDHQSAKIIGKGNKERWVFWHPRANAALVAYLQRRRGPISGPLLRGCSHRNNGGRLTRDAVRGMLKRYAKSIGVKLPKNAPVHCFRHGFVQSALDSGLDISEVSQLAGHASIVTTMLYAQRSETRLQKSHRYIARSKSSGQDRKVR